MEYNLIDSEFLILKHAATIAEGRLLTCKMHGMVKK